MFPHATINLFDRSFRTKKRFKKGQPCLSPLPPPILISSTSLVLKGAFDIMVELLQEEIVLTVGLNFAGFPPHRSANHNDATKLSHFQGAFGADPMSCCKMFYDIQALDIGLATIQNPKLDHFFVALSFLKTYQTEAKSAGTTGLHEDTVRKWVWKYCIAIQALKQYKVRTKLVIG